MARSPITKYRAENGDMTLEEFGRLFKPVVDKSTVLRWERDGVPAKRILEIEKLTGIPRHKLLPRLFARAPVTEAAE